MLFYIMDDLLGMYSYDRRYSCFFGAFAIEESIIDKKCLRCYQLIFFERIIKDFCRIVYDIIIFTHAYVAGYYFIIKDVIPSDLLHFFSYRTKLVSKKDTTISAFLQ